MAKSDSSLQGYSYDIHKRDHFKCRYCGADGAGSFDVWLTLSLDHLLPKDNPDRDNPDYTVTACRACNEADNHYFRHAEARGLIFDDRLPDELVAQRKPFVQAVRARYQEFWMQNVHDAPEANMGTEG